MLSFILYSVASRIYIVFIIYYISFDILLRQDICFYGRIDIELVKELVNSSLKLHFKIEFNGTCIVHTSDEIGICVQAQ